MQGTVLVINYGSLSIEFAVIIADHGDIIAEGTARHSGGSSESVPTKSLLHSPGTAHVNGFTVCIDIKRNHHCNSAVAFVLSQTILTKYKGMAAALCLACRQESGGRKWISQCLNQRIHTHSLQ